MKLQNFLWGMLARFLVIQAVTDWLIRRAQRTPYVHITSSNGQDTYMGRWWVFNPYTRGTDGETLPARWQWLPSIRVHHIMRPDNDRHLHDHPWNARTIVLRGWYREERRVGEVPNGVNWNPAFSDEGLVRASFHRPAGYTGRLLFGQYHRISEVSPGGVWTLFLTWEKQGTWGFHVDGKKVPYREYLGLDGEKS